MATPKMSAEEKAVRDALAQVEKDYAVSTAAVNAMNTGTPVPTPTASKPATSTGNAVLDQLNATLARLGAGVTKMETSLVNQATNIGYTYNPQTGAVTQGVTGSNTSGSTSGAVDPLVQLQKDKEAADRRDAFALLADTFKQYGLESLADTIKGYMTSNVGPEEAKVLLKQTEAYKTRFAGNIARVAAGKNAVDEATYLDLEDKYAQVLKAYGQEKLGSRTEYASLISNDISTIELGDRLKLAVDRVQKADPGIKAQLKAFYPGITDADLVTYFLKPDQALPDLERKVQASEIGAAAAAQGFDKGTAAEQIAGYKTKAEALAAYGVTRDQAITGYGNIAKVLPESEKLSKIYGEAKIDYTQATGEEEFLKDSVAASRKRKQLAELESAKFSGSSGMSTQYTSLGKSTQGKF